MSISPTQYIEFTDLLNQGQAAQFITAFNSLSTPELKAEYLACDFFKLAELASQKLHSSQYAQLVTPLKPQIHQYRLNKLAEFTKGQKFDDFIGYFKTISDEQIISTFLDKTEQSRAPLIQLALNNFTQVQLLEIINTYFRPILPELDRNPYEPPLHASPIAVEQPNTQHLRDFVKAVYNHSQPPSELTRSLITYIYLNFPAEVFLNAKFIQISLALNQKDFLAFIERIPYRSLPEAFFDNNDTQNHVLLTVLTQHGDEALVKILEGIVKDHIPALQKQLNLNINGKTLHQALLDIPGAHHGTLQGIIEETQQTQQSAVSSTSARTSPVYTFQDDDDDLHLPPALQSAHDDVSESSDSPKQSLDRYTEQELIQELKTNHQTLPKDKIGRLLDRISQLARFRLLTDNIGSGSLIESFVQRFTDAPEDILFILAPLTPLELFQLFSMPIKYGVEKGYVGGSIASGAMSVASVIPWASKHAAKLADKDLYESLLSFLVRTHPTLLSIFPNLLGECKPAEISQLLRTPDMNGETLFFTFLATQEAEKISQLLARADFESKDKDKLFDPKHYPPVKLRELFVNNSQKVGFFALLGVYHYICVRGQEPGEENYQSSKTEFLQMLKVLSENNGSNTITQALKKHCSDNPLRQAYAVPLATTSVALGTNRHLDARKNVEGLTAEELNAGLALFSAFVARHYEHSNQDITNLDSVIKKIFSGSAASASASSTSGSATCRA